MSSTSSSDRRESRGPRPKGASFGLPHLVGMTLIAMLAVTAACTTPASSEPEAARLLEPPDSAEVAGEATAGDPGGGGAGGGGGLVDSEELIGLGELGLLPSLLQSFGTLDCEFEDAFSTCQ